MDGSHCIWSGYVVNVRTHYNNENEEYFSIFLDLTLSGADFYSRMAFSQKIPSLF